MKKRILITLVVLLFVFSFAINLQAIPVQWPVEDGGNGHWYEVISMDANWDQAKVSAETMSYLGVNGYLATMTTSKENIFVATLLGTTPHHLWIGGMQPDGSPEPDGNWQWITGEPWIYSNWWTGEPSNSYSEGENALLMWAQIPGYPNKVGTWNDEQNTTIVTGDMGYIVEYAPEPATILLLTLGGMVFRKRK
ncbi:MAG: hypothetical protein A2Y13_02905 [Planctomycetes bacterium GWC2_45_44]|nr:MAG: hypothetical protein A2Y13_02905 [Planctomycetes bacterium GWC2_45_44]HBR19390.1 hypothetical protein [Phycisphaerales bacterium]